MDIAKSRGGWNKKERKLVSCACGCGTDFINVNKAGKTRRFIHGHNKPMLGKKRTFSAEHREKLRVKLVGRPVSEKSRLKMTGENNKTWKGELASYFAKHIWIKNHHGKAPNCQNVECKKKSENFQWASISGDYRNRKDYLSLCVSCHRKWDMNIIKIRTLNKIYA